MPKTAANVCPEPALPQNSPATIERIAEKIFEAYRAHKPDEIVPLFSDELRTVAPASRLLGMMQRHDERKGRFVSSRRLDRGALTTNGPRKRGSRRWC